MNVGEINNTIQGYLNNREISGGALLVRRNGELVYENYWGWADIASRRPIEENAIYRMMSMTKPVTAA
ncbi:MAG: beta-lactamase family protein, partial [Oscillospiraceae bacterium]|nr:beta-lactamase family protein [Oscillospiraceae bacterium]